MPQRFKIIHAKIGLILGSPTKQSEDVEAFLKNCAGVYQYRPRFRKAVFSVEIICLLGVPISAYNLFSYDQNSIYSTAKMSFLPVLGSYLLWSCVVVALGFKELRIDEEGISILPFGIHLSRDEIEEIRRSENFAGAGVIKLNLKSPCYIFHMGAWSWGRKLTIAFNKRLLTQAPTPT